MEMNSKETAIAATEPCCERKTSEEGSFANKMKNTFNDFTHSSINEYKTCFIASVKKVYDKVKINVPFGGDLIEEPVSPTNATEDRRLQASNSFE